MGSEHLTVCVVAAVIAGWWGPLAAAQSTFEGLFLSSFRGVTQTTSRGPQGSYKFSFSLPHQRRAEHRDEQGKVTGTYSFVDNVGREVSVTYDADHRGFRARSDALPQPPQDTPDVAKAKEGFLRHYERTTRLLRVLEEEMEKGEKEGEDSQSSEEDVESDENSTESSAEDDDSSSEEGTSSDEDDDDDDHNDEDEDDEENEEENEENDDDDNEYDEVEDDDIEEHEDRDENNDDSISRRLEYEEENDNKGDEKENSKEIREKDIEKQEQVNERRRQITLKLINVSLPGRAKIFLPLPVHVRERTGIGGLRFLPLSSPY